MAVELMAVDTEVCNCCWSQVTGAYRRGQNRWNPSGKETNILDLIHHVQPFIFSNRFLLHLELSLSQLSWGEGSVAPWTGRQFIAGPQQDKDKQR